MKDECAICFNEYEINNKLKYKCSVCDKKICNVCYFNYKKDNIRCIFCRNNLVITVSVNENKIMIYRFICCFFYIFLFFIGINFTNNNNNNNNLRSDFNTTKVNYNISY